MGKTIEKIAKERKHNISAILDTKDDWASNRKKVQASDVIIDFSLPASAVHNIRKAFELNVPIVTGTTGWDDSLDEIRRECTEGRHSLFFAANFSIGMNIFMQLNAELARLMNAFDDYDVKIEETHHIHKKDAPSGTAISLVNEMISKLERKKAWVLNRKPGPSEIRVDARRFDDVPGVHEVEYTGRNDEIRLLHAAKSRDGFAGGAVLAAEWLQDKEGFFGMKDMLFS